MRQSHRGLAAAAMLTAVSSAAAATAAAAVCPDGVEIIATPPRQMVRKGVRADAAGQILLGTAGHSDGRSRRGAPGLRDRHAALSEFRSRGNEQTGKGNGSWFM